MPLSSLESRRHPLYPFFPSSDRERFSMRHTDCRGCHPSSCLHCPFSFTSLFPLFFESQNSIFCACYFQRGLTVMHGSVHIATFLFCENILFPLFLMIAIFTIIVRKPVLDSSLFPISHGIFITIFNIPFFFRQMSEYIRHTIIPPPKIKNPSGEDGHLTKLTWYESIG